jgi:hypothetical protein
MLCLNIATLFNEKARHSYSSVTLILNIKAEGFLLQTMSTDGRGCYMYAASFISTLLRHRNIQQVAFLHSEEVYHHDVILQFLKDLLSGV